MYDQLFSRQEEIFKVIASRKRLEIIQLLTHGELSVNAMVGMLGIPQSNVSQHLAQLRQSHIVVTRKDGTVVYYKLSDPRIAEACSLVRRFLVDLDHLPKSAAETDWGDMYPLVQDPVCKMRMGISEVSEQIKRDGKTYYFCASGCRREFEREPDAHAGGAFSEPESGRVKDHHKK